VTAYDAVAFNEPFIVNEPDSPTDPLSVGENKLADVCRTNVFPVPVVGVGSP
jgi:hypothetical protein